MKNSDLMTLGIVGIVGYFFLSKTSTAAAGSTSGVLPGNRIPFSTSGSSAGGKAGGGGGTFGGGGGGGTGPAGGGGTAVSNIPTTTPGACDPPMPGCPGYVDSEDPCDPTSTAYNPEICNSYIAGGANPCDPTSTAYDVYLCSQGYSGTTGSGGTDSGDPCDPSSVEYNEAVCIELQGGAGGGDSGNPCDSSSAAYDENLCSEIQNGAYPLI